MDIDRLVAEAKGRLHRSIGQRSRWARRQVRRGYRFHTIQEYLRHQRRPQETLLERCWYGAPLGVDWAQGRDRLRYEGGGWLERSTGLMVV